jgi:hypothetical protein
MLVNERIMLQILLTEAATYHGRSKKQIVDLRRQVELAWDSLNGGAEERYNRLKGRLTTLFLWDREHEMQRDLECPPDKVLEEYRLRQRERLLSLPPGQLFHAPTAQMCN